MCRVYTLRRSVRGCKIVCIGPVLEATTTCSAGLHSTEVFIPSEPNSTTIRRGLNQYACEIIDLEHFVAAGMMGQFVGQGWCGWCVVALVARVLGVSVVGWTRWQLRQTRLHLLVAWRHMEDIDTRSLWRPEI